MKILLVSLLLISCLRPFGNTYYISASGVVSNDGLSAATPWPVSKVKGNFPNGTRFLFKRGDTFNGTINTSGNTTTYVTNPADTLVYGAYGTGPKPIITTRSSFPGWNIASRWTLSTIPNVWRFEVITNVLSFYPRLWLSGGGSSTGIEWQKAADSSHVDAKKRTCFFNGSHQFIYVYATSNPAKFYRNIEFPGINNNTLSLSNQDFVVIRDLDIRGATGATIDLEFCRSVVIKNCNIGWDCGRLGIRSNHALDIDINNNTIDSGDRSIDSFLVEQGLGDGIYIAEGSKRWKVYKNYIADFGHSNIEITNYSKDSLKDIYVYENYITAPHVDYCRGLGADCNNGSNIVVERNKFENLPVQCQMECKGIIFRYNIINNITNCNHMEQGTGTGISIMGYGKFKPQGMQIVNNLISNCAGPGIDFTGTLAHDGSYEEALNNLIANNIFYNNGRDVKNASWYPSQFVTGVQLYIRDDPDVLNNQVRNNAFYVEGKPALIFYGHCPKKDYLHTVSQFNAENSTRSDVITNNIIANPLFLNPVKSIFEVSDQSPLIGKGVNLGAQYENALQVGSTWPSGVRTTKQVSQWNIGPYAIAPHAAKK